MENINEKYTKKEQIKFEEMEVELHQLKHEYGGRVGPYLDLWNNIKNNRRALEWATEIFMTRWGETTINAQNICHEILTNYDNVDVDIYNDLVNKIYSDKNIARIVAYKDLYCRGNSFLTKTLQNLSLPLTEEQKSYVVDEALTSKTAAHTYGNDFDIRYWILRNYNWTNAEKEELVLKLFPNDAFDYEMALEKWKYDVLNSYHHFNGHTLSSDDMENLFDYTYDDLYDIYGNEEAANELAEEIAFIDFANPLWLNASEKGMTKTIGTIGVTKNRG